jgi:hypothetical protein
VRQRAISQTGRRGAKRHFGLGHDPAPLHLHSSQPSAVHRQASPPSSDHTYWPSPPRAGCDSGKYEPTPRPPACEQSVRRFLEPSVRPSPVRCSSSSPSSSSSSLSPSLLAPLRQPRGTAPYPPRRLTYKPRQKDQSMGTQTLGMAPTLCSG